MQLGHRPIRIAAVLVTLFGILTVFSGGNALFGSAETRAAVGDAVPFVLWFNFLAGFAYVAAGVGLFLRQSWAVRVSIAILVTTVLVMIAFGLHVWLGGAYEMRTVWAMSLRTVIWSVVASLAIRDTEATTPAMAGGQAISEITDKGEFR